MLKPTYFFATILISLLTACGGGSSGSNSLTNVPQVISSSVSSQSSSAQSSSVQSSSVQSSASSSSLATISSSSSSQTSSSSSLSARSLASLATVFQVGSSVIAEPLIEVAPTPTRVQKGESFNLQAVAFSAEGEIKKINWKQVSGPSITFTEDAEKLVATSGEVGEVVLQASATDRDGKSISKKITFTVEQPFSAKARLLQGSSNGQGLDLVIVGDGFLASDQEKLAESAKSALTYMFEYDNDSLKPYKPLFNVWLVESISETRDIPQNGSSGATLFGTFFNCANIFRLLCANDQKVIDVVAEQVPQYDQILVLVNSTIYGGAGGQLSTASLHPESRNIVLHELGHSLVRLADEYVDNGGVPDNSEPAEVNVTANTNPLEVKWNYWFDNKSDIPGYNRNNYSFTEVGYFLGGKYSPAGIWRPTYDSIMRSLNAPFGSVNREAWALTIWSYYNARENFLPATQQLQASDKPLIFSIPSIIDYTYMNITWWVNDQKIEGQKSTPFLIISSADKSLHSVKVTAEDSTKFIRRDLNGVSKFEHTWSIQ